MALATIVDIERIIWYEEVLGSIQCKSRIFRKFDDFLRVVANPDRGYNCLYKSAKQIRSGIWYISMKRNRSASPAPVTKNTEPELMFLIASVIKQHSREAYVALFPNGRDVTCSSSRFFGSSRLLEEQSVETTDMIPYEYGQRL